MRTKRSIELILDHPTLNPHPALLGIDFQDLRQMPGKIDDQAFGQGLPVRSRASPSWRQHNAPKIGARHQAGQACHISCIHRKHSRLRHALVDGVVSRQHRTRCILRGNLPTKTRGTQLLQECAIVLGKLMFGRETGNHPMCPASTRKHERSCKAALLRVTEHTPH
ncbi:hypothetical protein D9M68_839830 [compost metagenome]